MFKTEATVCEKQGSDVILSADRGKMCGCCSNMFCGTKKNTYIKTRDELGLKKGDTVALGIDSRAIVVLNILIFLVPSLIFVLIIAMGGQSRMFISFLASIAAVIVYFVCVKLFLIKKLTPGLSCKIIRRLA